MEQRLLEGQRHTEGSLREAMQRLEEAEARAAEAEARAASAEHLAELRRQELESERRLRETLERIGVAEARTRAAEERARRAGSGVRLEEHSGLEREAEPGDWTPQTPSATRLAELALRVSERPPTPGPPPGPEPPPPPSPEPEEPAPQGLIDINQATYDDLRALNLSVGQAGRVLAYRERSGGFTSLEELDQIPGFSDTSLADLKRRATT